MIRLQPFSSTGAALFGFLAISAAPAHSQGRTDSVEVLPNPIEITGRVLIVLIPERPPATDSVRAARWLFVRDSLAGAYRTIAREATFDLLLIPRVAARLMDRSANALYEPPQTERGYILAAPMQRPQLIAGYVDQAELRARLQTFLGHLP